MSSETVDLQVRNRVSVGSKHSEGASTVKCFDSMDPSTFSATASLTVCPETGILLLTPDSGLLASESSQSIFEDRKRT